MQIIHDHSYITQAEREFISRGYACESFYSLRFSYIIPEAQKAEDWAYAAASAQRRIKHMERIANLLARNFKICQYDEDEAVPYKSDWDLFFWCNDLTKRGLPSGRDYGYFTLSFNDKHDPERRRKTYDRAMRILELFSDDGNLHVAVQYAAVMDKDKIKHDAELAAPGIIGRSCVYDGMEGRVETNGEALFFRKKRSRKYIYKLADAAVLSISWQLSAQPHPRPGVTRAEGGIPNG